MNTPSTFQLRRKASSWSLSEIARIMRKYPCSRRLFSTALVKSMKNGSDMNFS